MQQQSDFPKVTQQIRGKAGFCVSKASPSRKTLCYSLLLICHQVVTEPSCIHSGSNQHDKEGSLCARVKSSTYQHINISTPAFSFRFCQENRTSISVQVRFMLLESQPEHVPGSSLEVNVSQGSFPIGSANNLQALCADDQVVIRGKVRGNCCIWN